MRGTLLCLRSDVSPPPPSQPMFAQHRSTVTCPRGAGRGRFPTCIRVIGAHRRISRRFSPGVAQNSRPRVAWNRRERMPVNPGHPASIPRPIPFGPVPPGVANTLTWDYRPSPFQTVKRGQPDNAEVTSSILVSPTRFCLVRSLALVDQLTGLDSHRASIAWDRSHESPTHPLCSGPVSGRGDLCVEAEGHLRACVSESALGRLHVDAFGDEGRGGQPTEIVEPESRDVGPLTGRDPVALPEVRVLEVPSVATDEEPALTLDATLRPKECDISTPAEDLLHVGDDRHEETPRSLDRILTKGPHRQDDQFRAVNSVDPPPIVGPGVPVLAINGILEDLSESIARPVQLAPVLRFWHFQWGHQRLLPRVGLSGPPIYGYRDGTPHPERSQASP